MGEEKKRCSYENCSHEYFATWEGNDYCIFHAPADVKTDHINAGRFKVSFDRFLEETIRNYVNASICGKRKITLDCKGFIFPPSGFKLTSREFPFKCDFEEAHFTGVTSFSVSTFFRSVNFKKAKFSSEARFLGTSFLGYTDFNAVEFSSGVIFSGTQFLNGGSFEEVRKLTQADFFGADIRGVDFTDAIIGEFAQKVVKPGRNDGGNGCDLNEGITLVPVGSAEFLNVRYNDFLKPTQLFLYTLFYPVVWTIRKVLSSFFRRKDILKSEWGWLFVHFIGDLLDKPGYRPFQFFPTWFTHVDTSAVDWSNNPRLVRDIHRQQFIASLIEPNSLIKFVFNYSIFLLWWLTSRCGESIGHWLLYSTYMVIIFALVYAYVPGEGGKPLVSDVEIYSGRCSECGTEVILTNDDYYKTGGVPVTEKKPPSVFTALYFSIIAFTTLGLGDVTPASNWGKVVVCIEVFLGYIMLGGLVALFANKLIYRR